MPADRRQRGRDREAGVEALVAAAFDEQVSGQFGHVIPPRMWLRGTKAGHGRRNGLFSGSNEGRRVPLNKVSTIGIVRTCSASDKRPAITC